LSGRAVEDAARLLAAITSGRSFSTVRALAWPAALEFSATAGDHVLGMGGRLPAAALRADGARFEASVPQAPGARLTLWRDGVQIATGRGDLAYPAAAGESGVYRIEASLPGASVPWIVSNPIVMGEAPGGAGVPPTPSAGPAEWHELGGADDRWVIEKDPTSSASRAAEDASVRFDYSLGSGAPSGQYAALVVPVDVAAGVDRVSFVGRADRPIRLSVQIRLTGGLVGRRWRHSVYLDSGARPITIRLQDFEPAEGNTGRRPVVAPIQSLLFVLDTVNTAPGSGGRVWLSDVRLGVDRLDE
jgi:hypothetical protein